MFIMIFFVVGFGIDNCIYFDYVIFFGVDVVVVGFKIIKFIFEYVDDGFVFKVVEDYC